MRKLTSYIVAAHVKSVGCLRESNIAEKNQLLTKIWHLLHTFFSLSWDAGNALNYVAAVSGEIQVADN